MSTQNSVPEASPSAEPGKGPKDRFPRLVWAATQTCSMMPRTLAVIDASDLRTSPTLALDFHPGEPVGGMTKRVIDVSTCAIAVLLLSPLLLLVACLVRLTMGRPVFYMQRRIGYKGQEFDCLKFRTMVPDADQRLAHYLAENPEAAAEWRINYKLRSDPRVPFLGHLLRRSSLDELPQLFNVIKGDMSCVGPRPIVAAEIWRYGNYVGEYSEARPGLTGLWQVSGRSKLSYRRRVALDRYYVRRWSLKLDILILLRTLPAVLTHDDTA